MREPAELVLDRVLLDMEGLGIGPARRKAPDAGGELQQRAALAGGLGCGRGHSAAPGQSNKAEAAAASRSPGSGGLPGQPQHSIRLRTEWRIG